MGIYKNNIRPFLSHPLNRNNKIKSVIRFIKWQFILRITNRNNAWLMALHDCGFRVLTKKGQTGMTGNLYSGLLEFEEMMFVIHFIREDDVFFDVGANVGIYSLLASYLKKARAHCFEPVPSTFYFLRMNMLANNLEDLVTCYNKGVGDKLATLKFASDMDAMNKIVEDGYSGKVVEAEVVRLDDFFQKKPLESYGMFKIDTEGYEHNVLKGADSIISNPRIKAVLVEMNDAENIHGFLSAKGFTACEYNPFTRQLKEIGHLSKANIIYIKDLPFVRERVQTADKFCIRGYEF